MCEIYIAKMAYCVCSKNENVEHMCGYYFRAVMALTEMLPTPLRKFKVKRLFHFLYFYFFTTEECVLSDPR